MAMRHAASVVLAIGCALTGAITAVLRTASVADVSNSPRRSAAALAHLASLTHADEAAYLEDRSRFVRGRVVSATGDRVVASLQLVDSRSLTAELERRTACGLDALLSFEPEPETAATTAADGTFDLRDVGLGHKVMFARAAGHAPTRRNHVLIGDGWGVDRLEVEMPPASRCRVAVPRRWIGRSARPVYTGAWPGADWESIATPEIWIEQRHPDGWPMRIATRDALGAIELYRLPPGVDPELGIRADQLVRDGLEAADAVEGLPDLIEDCGATLPAAAARTGLELATPAASPDRATRLSIRPFQPHSVVRLRLPDGTWITRFSDGYGELELLGLPAGPHVANAILSNGLPSEVAGINVLPGRAATLYLTRTPQRVRSSTNSIVGFVLANGGSACAEAEVRCVLTGEGAGARRRVESDAEGFFRIDNVPDGAAFTLTYSRGRWGDVVRSVSRDLAVDPDARFVVLRIEGVELQLILPADTPADAHFTLSRTGEARGMPPVNRAVESTVRFRDVEPGTYEITCGGAGRPDRKSTPISVDAASGVVRREITWADPAHSEDG